MFFPMMQFLFARHMFMHCMFIFPSFLCLKVFVLFLFFSLSLSLSLSLCTSWHPKRLFLLKTRFMMRWHTMTFLRTFLIGQFIQNARSFYLIFQTLLYLVRLALGDGLLFLKNLHGVSMCTYRSFTPTCTSSIPLYLGLLWYSEVHAS